MIKTPCPSGKTSTASATAESSCTDVPIGSYRLGPTVHGTITAGYYVDTAGEYFALPTRLGGPCPPGSFCINGIKTDCVAGTRCENQLASTN